MLLFFFLRALIWILLYPISVSAFSQSPIRHDLDHQRILQSHQHSAITESCIMESPSRRDFLSSTASLAVLNTLSSAAVAIAAEPELAIEMKDFTDPQGMFSIKIPKEFFTLRRSAKGDLPDEKSGAGRRGSSIFSAGNMAKAEIVAVER